MIRLTPAEKGSAHFDSYAPRPESGSLVLIHVVKILLAAGKSAVEVDDMEGFAEDSRYRVFAGS
jgi:hypothetical protein